MFFAYLPWGIEYCETDFRLNGGRPVNKTAPVAVLCIFVKGCLTFELEYILFRDVIH